MFLPERFLLVTEFFALDITLPVFMYIVSLSIPVRLPDFTLFMDPMFEAAPVTLRLGLGGLFLLWFLSLF